MSNLNRKVWERPPPGTIIVNVDGAYKDDNMASGIVARNDRGRFICYRATHTGGGSPIQSKAFAFLADLRMVAELKVDRAIIGADSSKMVYWLNGDDICDWKVRAQVTMNQHILRSLPGVSIRFTPRRCNGAAHVVASFSLTHGVTQFWNGDLPPPFILDSLFADMPNECN